MADQTVSASEIPSPQTNPVDAPAWLQQFQVSQTQQMLMLIQHQGQRLDQVAQLVSQAQEQPHGGTGHIPTGNIGPSSTLKRLRAKLPDPEIHRRRPVVVSSIPGQTSKQTRDRRRRHRHR
ncbi:hypothetical protein V1509DRAFT_611927 [Lipomyces kononenkoae]